MAFGNKSRPMKRSSPTSYAPTVTMVVFVGLCFLGVWMMTSDSPIPVNITQTSSRSSDEPQTSATEKPSKTPTFEDNPGELPEEAIKPDDGRDRERNREQRKEDEAAGDENSSPAKEETTGSEEAKVTTEASDEKEEKGSDQNGGDESVSQTKEESSDESRVTTDASGEKEEKVSDQGNGDEKRDGKKDLNADEESRLTTVASDIKEESNGKEEKGSKGDENREKEKELNTSDEATVTTDASDAREESNEKEEKGPNSDEKIERKKDLNVAGDEEGKKAIPGGGGESYSGIPKESKASKETWSTQAAQSESEKERRKDESDSQDGLYGYTWRLCNVTAGSDYIPCLDNEKAVKKLRSTHHFEHRERHCPENAPTCLVPVPEGYKRSIAWPASRDKIWYHNVPHTLLAEVKGHQNWVKVTGEFLTFPGGGTQFIHGALHYIDFLQKAVPGIAWGKRTRVILDVGCGVASFGGYIFERDVLTMSFAPKDEHEAQVQFALERGIPAISAVMGSQRLPFPSRVFDLIHCARCRVPWHAEGGLLLLELNRVLRPGGYFVWSATPVYQKLEEDVEIWNAMSALTKSMCWELVTIQRDKLNSVGAAIYRKPTTNECYDQRKKKHPPMCQNDDDANAAWYVLLQTCMHRVPVDEAERGTRWPEMWPKRLQTPPYWLNDSQMGIYGKPASQDFAADYEHWKRVVNTSYLTHLGISWNDVRNVMDMRAVYGGFAAAMKDMKMWVVNVVNVDSPDTLPIIYERGLFGIYHDWCESFSTYPRSYDLLHADHLFSRLQKRCKLAPVLAEVDRMVRPGGKLIVRDESRAIAEVENLLKSLHWEVRLKFSKNQEGILSAQKGDWRPKAIQDSTSS